MSVADDLVAAQQPFTEASPDGSHEQWLRALGSMFAQMESYATDPDAPDIPEWFVNIPNQVLNPSFEYDVAGGAPAQWSYPPAQAASFATFAVSTGWASRGLQSLRIVTAALASGQSVNVRASGPDPGPGPMASIFGWNVSRVQNGTVGVCMDYNIGNAGGGTWNVWLQIDCYDGNGITLGGRHTPTTNDSTAGVRSNQGVLAFIPGTVWFTLTLYINSTAATGVIDASFDSVGLFFDPAGIVPTCTDGDTPGWQWTGIPGQSASELLPPLPQVGWRKMMDVDEADTVGLPYLAQWIGERLPAGMADALMRQQIRQNPNAYRGTLAAAVRGIQPMLTGSHTVFTRERYMNNGTPDVNWLAMMTYASETPNPTLVGQQLRNKLVGANIMLDYQTFSRNTWTIIETPTNPWSTIESGPKTWTQIETALGIPGGYVIWTL
jgi:hypothetical protein